MSKRIECAINGVFTKASGSAQGYAWFIWKKGYNGDSILDWN